jgi:hypothetical protein
MSSPDDGKQPSAPTKRPQDWTAEHHPHPHLAGEDHHLRTEPVRMVR